jgi:hypothetical protein
MKKAIFGILFLLISSVGFSQMSKTDAYGFLSRNPLKNCSRVYIESLPDPVNQLRDAVVTWKIADVVSLTSMDSGLSLVIRYDDFNKEKFIPYSTIRSIFIAGDNSFVISLLR